MGRSIRAGLIGSSNSILAYAPHAKRRGRGPGTPLSLRSVRPGPDRRRSAALPRLLDQLEASGYAGVNVTHPCKQQVIDLSQRALPGSASDRRGEHGALRGRSKDRAQHGLVGLRRGLRTWIARRAASTRSCCSARAARARRSPMPCFGSMPSTSSYSTSTPRRADALVGSLSTRVGDRTPRSGRTISLMRSSAPTGSSMPPQSAWKNIPASPSIRDLLEPRSLGERDRICPARNRAGRIARPKGCRVSDGSGMAVFQAVDAFELFTGRAADIERMFSHFSQFEPV